MKTLTLTIALALTSTAYAQQKPDAAPAPPQLTASEQVAVQTLYERQDAVNQMAKAVFTDIEARHPGYHWDVQTRSLVAVTAPAPAKK